MEVTVNWAVANQSRIKDINIVLKLKGLLEAEQELDPWWWANRSYDRQRLSWRVDHTLQLHFGRNWKSLAKRAAKKLGM